ncbi:adenylate/guanylate cyclase domain-containing protein [Pannonibacter tanglangensis]|uniref:HAMP domain-containing protein n=1 Tax=Pannonibacter tanglangensis TaxID=2750084 RepID=A0ABW9ZDU1_9HYPH|nr:adenylate/guanylate cyclase domain-containing protein [Pannonibacter sp. XCT-34]NBN62861.1 HAMP domain-containing protein [Pannonibacter sp. XCT-34]
MAARPRFMGLRQIPLTRVVSLGFGLLVGAAVSLVLFMMVKANVQNTFSLLNDKAILIIQSMERQVRGYLDQMEDAVVALKVLLDEDQITLSDKEGVLADLSAALAANSRITVLLITDPKGETYGVYKAPNGKLWPFRKASDVPGGVRHALPEVMPSSRPVWGPLVTNSSGVFANVTVPIVQDGKPVAYLTAATSMSSLGDAVRALDEGPDSTTFIINGEDELIVHSDQHLLLTGGSPQATLPAPVARFGDPVLAGVPTGEHFSTFQKAADLGIEVLGIEANGEDFILMRVPITGYSETPWIIGQYFRGTSVSREIRRLSGSAVVGFGAMIVAVLLAIWLGRRVARPLRDIAEQSEHVGRLALDEVTPLPRSRVKELDQVALAFNAMVIGLKAMNTYVPRSLFRKLMRLGIDRAAKAREAELTMLFSDIVGFTAVSEHLTAAETAELLNEHFGLLVEAVEGEGGTVDKFIGDGMLAFWGAPDARADHAVAAVRTAQRISQAVKTWNQQQIAAGRPAMRLRIGLHSGSVVVGNVGALDRWNYTIVGDAVNVCERLQSLGREVAPDDEVVILASDATITRLPPGCVCAPVGSHRLRGRSGDVEVWKLDADADPALLRDVDGQVAAE